MDKINGGVQKEIEDAIASVDSSGNGLEKKSDEGHKVLLSKPCYAESSNEKPRYPPLLVEDAAYWWYDQRLLIEGGMF